MNIIHFILKQSVFVAYSMVIQFFALYLVLACSHRLRHNEWGQDVPDIFSTCMAAFIVQFVIAIGLLAVSPWLVFFGGMAMDSGANPILVIVAVVFGIALVPWFLILRREYEITLLQFFSFCFIASFLYLVFLPLVVIMVGA